MTLLDFIKKSKDALLVFGKKETLIIEKQLKGIKLTQSEKNRLSRSIRPKLDFIKRCSVYKDEFNMKKGGDVFKKLEMLKDEILTGKFGRILKRIYIFGSFVENKMSMDSDVDVAVEFNKITRKDASMFKIAIQSDNMLHISVFNLLDDNLKEEVKENGRIFYEI
jgi:predicted nucleotidyltransferase